MEDHPDRQHFRVTRKFSAAVLTQIVRSDPGLLEPDLSTGEAEEIEIATRFSKMIAALRHLPKRERPAARKAAKDWRTLALKALQDKRANLRRARHAFRTSLRLELR